MSILWRPIHAVQLIFRWSDVSPSCPVVHYRILAYNCGQCPHTTSNTTVTCTGNYIQHNNFSYCSLSVQTVTCNSIFGEVSTVINVALTDISLGLVPNMSQNVPTLESNFSQGTEDLLLLTTAKKVKSIKYHYYNRISGHLEC